MEQAVVKKNIGKENRRQEVKDAIEKFEKAKQCNSDISCHVMKHDRYNVSYHTFSKKLFFKRFTC